MPNIILIGFMASGKSTLGKKLASKLAYTFVDTDALVEQLTGKSVSEIFEQDGEAVFREKEREVLQHLAHIENHVIATGGGLPCFFDNMERLNEMGVTVYLKASPNNITQRLLTAKKPRPLVAKKTEAELLLFVTDLLQEREKFYEQAKIILVGKEQRIPAVYERLQMEIKA